MEQKRTQHAKYTFEDVKELAEKYDKLADFTKNHFAAYEAALANGWMDSFTHLQRKRVHTVESVLNECKKFNSYKEFMNADESIANAFRRFYKRNHITDADLPWEFKKRKKSWTREDCYEEAKKYDSRYQMKLGSESAYESARKNNWLDNYTWFKPSHARS